MADSSCRLEFLMSSLPPQAGMKASEDEMKRRAEERREDEEEIRNQEEQLMLQGPSIHECCQSGDLVRVKKLIQHSPDVIR